MEPRKVGTETRKEDYEAHKARGERLPEMIEAGPNVSSMDVNVTDIRDIFDDGSKGPWRRA